MTPMHKRIELQIFICKSSCAVEMTPNVSEASHAKSHGRLNGLANSNMQCTLDANTLDSSSVKTSAGGKCLAVL